MMPDLLLEGDIAHIGCFEFKLIIFKYSVINLISNQEGVFHCVSYAWILSTLLPNNASKSSIKPIGNQGVILSKS